MKKIWKKITIAVLAAAMVLPTSIGVYAGGPELYLADETSTIPAAAESMEFETVNASGENVTAHFTQYANITAQPFSVVDGKLAITYKQVQAFKTFWNPAELIPASGNGVYKIESKYSLDTDTSLAQDLKYNVVMVAYYGSGSGDSLWFNGAVSDAPIEPGVEHTTTYYIDAVNGKASLYLDGEFRREWDAAQFMTADIFNIRLYPQIFYEGHNDEDALPTDVTWYFDYFKIQRMDALEATANLADGSVDVDPDAAFTLEFDLPVDANTVNSDTVILEAETPTGYETVAADVSMDNNICTVQPQETLDATTHYRIRITDQLLPDGLPVPGSNQVVTNFTTAKRQFSEPVEWDTSMGNVVTLQINGVESDVLASGAVACTANLIRTEGDTQARVIAAVYEKDANGILRYLSSAEQVETFADGASGSVTCDPITVPEGDQYLVRVMVWDAETGYPLTDAVEFTMGQGMAYAQ